MVYSIRRPSTWMVTAENNRLSYQEETMTNISLNFSEKAAPPARTLALGYVKFTSRTRTFPAGVRQESSEFSVYGLYLSSETPPAQVEPAFDLQTGAFDG